MSKSVKVLLGIGLVVILIAAHVISSYNGLVGKSEGCQ